MYRDELFLASAATSEVVAVEVHEALILSFHPAHSTALSGRLKSGIIILDE